MDTNETEWCLIRSSAHLKKKRWSMVRDRVYTIPPGDKGLGIPNVVPDDKHITDLQLVNKSSPDVP